MRTLGFDVWSSEPGLSRLSTVSTEIICDNVDITWVEVARPPTSYTGGRRTSEKTNPELPTPPESQGIPKLHRGDSVIRYATKFRALEVLVPRSSETTEPAGV